MTGGRNGPWTDMDCDGETDSEGCGVAQDTIPANSNKPSNALTPVVIRPVCLFFVIDPPACSAFMTIVIGSVIQSMPSRLPSYGRIRNCSPEQHLILFTNNR